MRIGTLLVAVGAMALIWGCSNETKTSDVKSAEDQISKMEQQLQDMKKQLAEEKQRLAESKPAPAPGERRSQAAKPKPKPKPAPPPKPVIRTVTIEPGTALTVRTMNTISTNSAGPGEHFTVSLEEPLVQGGRTIAPKGALAEGVVVESNQGGRVQGRAVLAVTLTSLTLPDGKRVEIATNTIGNHARKSTKKDAAKVGIGAGIGAVIGAIAGGGKGAAIGAGVGAGAGTAGVLLTRGNAAQIPAESVLHFELTGPVTVRVK